MFSTEHAVPSFSLLNTHFCTTVVHLLWLPKLSSFSWTKGIFQVQARSDHSGLPIFRTDGMIHPKISSLLNRMTSYWNDDVSLGRVLWGLPTRKMGTSTYYLLKISQKLYEIDKNWTERGRALLMPPSPTLGSANVLRWSVSNSCSPGVSADSKHAFYASTY